LTWSIGDAPYPRVKGVQGSRYKVGPLCAVPTCGRLADHAHHLWSRSYLGKPYDWVVVTDPEVVSAGVMLPNLLPLCWSHHEDCTGAVGGYRAGIRYEPDSGLLFWANGDGEQELIWGTSTSADPRIADTSVELCSECGRRKPRLKAEGVAPRTPRAKTRVVFTVPKDEREDGDAIIREHLSNCAELIGRSENEDYYTLVDVLSWFAFNYHPEAEEYTGEGPCPTCGNDPGQM
jgi:hypothetical protein